MRATLTSTLLAAIVLTGAACTPERAAARPPLNAPSTTAPAAPPSATPTAKPPPEIAPQRVSPRTLARLPKATTFGTTRAAPRDPNPRARPSGLLVHPKRMLPVFARPGGRSIAAVPATQLGAKTWLPVIQQRPGWLRVLLPSRPNGSTGWLHRHPTRVQLAESKHLITVDRARFRLTLHRDGKPARSWTIGVGKPSAVTPAGRTFVLANVYDAGSKFSKIVLPLGSHSDTFTRYGGGPGTVGIHTWPTADVYGTASSDGCIRVPPAALRLLSRTVPLGTPVVVT
jgi:lipoprotein-anchoring transpeptidase ErfK/SrfK